MLTPDQEYAFGPVPVVNGSLVTGFPVNAEVCDNVFIDNPACSFNNLTIKTKNDFNYEKTTPPINLKLYFFE